MSIETRVGLFVLIGLGISAVSVMKLSNIRLEKRYTLYVIFDDVQSLREKGPVKIAGVDIGAADKIELDQGRAKITARIKSNVAIFANAHAKIKQTGVIGTQYIEIQPGTPEAARLKDGDTLYGDKTKSLTDLVEKLSELIEGKEGKPGIGDDLKATMSNLRSITDSLNAAIGKQKADLVDIVRNLHDFTADLKGMASDLHEVTSSKKEEIEASITKLKSILDRLDEITAKVQRGEGAVGRLINDKEVGDEVKKTVSNLKDTSESAKQVLSRFTKIRSFWEFQARAVPAASALRGDGGIRLQPKEGKYYYLGVNNIGDRKDEFKNANDYEKKNTITALLGKVFGPFTVEVGAIRSTGGIGLKYYPFKKESIAETLSENYKAQEPSDWKENIELNAQAFDFGRDETRGKAGQERTFNKPHFNVGAKYHVNRFVRVGAAVEDLAEVRQYSILTHLVFEDKDLAYLFGFVSFAR